LVEITTTGHTLACHIDIELLGEACLQRIGIGLHRWIVCLIVPTQSNHRSEERSHLEEHVEVVGEDGRVRLTPASFLVNSVVGGMTHRAHSNSQQHKCNPHRATANQHDQNQLTPKIETFDIYQPKDVDRKKT
jgi:hypothetical protein